MSARTISAMLLVLAIARAAAAAPLGTAFSYQGQLQQDGTPTDGTCDFQFQLFDAPGSGSPPTGGNKLGSDQAVPNVTVTDGVFTVLLNGAGQFGGTAFAGENRWLQIGVTCPATGGHIFTVLSPRQPVTAAPYALYAPTAGSANNLSCNGCINVNNLADGAVSIAKIAAVVGDVTAVHAGPGLIGGGSSGDVELGANFGGNGGAATVAHGDHDHGGQSWATASGLQVEAKATDGIGLLGMANTGAGARGVKGTSVQGTGVTGEGVFGVSGSSSAKTGLGMYGRATGSSGTGVLGVSEVLGADGSGVRGESTSGGVGVGGTTKTGTGVHGIATAGTGVGGESDTGRGVLGISNSGQGVYGASTTDTGVVASSESGRGLTTVSGSGVALVATGTSANLIEAYKNGRPAVRKFYVSNAGEVFAAGAYHANGADVAEAVPTSDHLEAGDVVEIDPLHPGQFRRASTPNSTGVAGVISTQPGVALREAEATDAPDDAPQLALVGRVPVKASAEHGAIRPGDLLVAATTPGRAMRAPENPAVGSVVGKALGELESGSGTIQMLVMLR